MIPDFKTYIKESIWSNINKRSEGSISRKEDDINILDEDALVEYLKKRYKPLKRYAIITNSAHIIAVPIAKTYVNYSICFNPKLEYMTFTQEIVDLADGLIEKLKDKFIVNISKYDGYISKYDGDMIYKISPKNGDKANNEFFINVIDFLLDNIPEEYKSMERVEEKS